jgi:hypothetical protein
MNLRNLADLCKDVKRKVSEKTMRCCFEVRSVLPVASSINTVVANDMLNLKFDRWIPTVAVLPSVRRRLALLVDVFYDTVGLPLVRQSELKHISRDEESFFGLLAYSHLARVRSDTVENVTHLLHHQQLASSLLATMVLESFIHSFFLSFFLSIIH